MRHSANAAVRDWRKRLRHEFGRVGVECLRLIGTDMALSQLAELALDPSLQGIAEGISYHR